MRLAKSIATFVTVAAIGLSAVPAQAGGQISFGFAPSNPQQAEALNLGLQVFSLVQGLSNEGATVSQNGSGNAAGIDQGGRNNRGLIYQEGNGHSGTIRQRGNGNSCGLFQFGSATNAECIQRGSNRSAITTVFGF
ncbi:curlin [Devosia sp. PTR5]|uniref:Curlin n=1 Tax=Devosia oryzisoli TaxID=2774138 RepID=A0A927FT62_9HYPH|nr:curlin [Devosia oryzisoli]MBD8064283.1 curlin [Devosia oryzisoli]